MRVAYNDQDDRAGLCGYVQFNKYTYIHTCIAQVRIVQVERVCPLCRAYSEVFVTSIIIDPTLLGRINASGI